VTQKQDPWNIFYLQLQQALSDFDSFKKSEILLLDILSDKPVGFYGPIPPPVPNASSSECPRASIAARRRAAGSIRISRRASCCCSSAIAGIAIGANFKIYLLRQFCSNRVEFFYNTQETQTQKMMDQNFEIRIL